MRREKELRMALVCYGGISLAVYMHGITKEIWRLARASRAFHGERRPAAAIDRAHLSRSCSARSRSEADLRLRVLPDIIAGASAGGINGVFLAQAIATGQSLEPLTQLWLDTADIEALIDPKQARAAPLDEALGAADRVDGAATRRGADRRAGRGGRARARCRPSCRNSSARAGSSRRSGVKRFSNLILDALEAMAAGGGDGRLLPDRPAARPVRHRHRFPRASRTARTPFAAPR